MCVAEWPAGGRPAWRGCIGGRRANGRSQAPCPFRSHSIECDRHARQLPQPPSAPLAQTRAWRPPQTTMAAENEENNEVILSKLPIARPDSPSAATATAAAAAASCRLSACLPAHHLPACPPFLLPQPQKPQTREAGETAAAMDKVTDLVRQREGLPMGWKGRGRAPLLSTAPAMYCRRHACAHAY